MRCLILTALLALAASCVTSPVVPLDDGSYLVSVHTSFGLTPTHGLLAKAADTAQEYCARRGQTAHIKSQFGTGVPPFSTLSGNMVFSCVAQGTAAAGT